MIESQPLPNNGLLGHVAGSAGPNDDTVPEALVLAQVVVTPFTVCVPVTEIEVEVVVVVDVNDVCVPQLQIEPPEATLTVVPGAAVPAEGAGGGRTVTRPTVVKAP